MIKKVFIVLFFIGIGLVVVGLALTKGDFSKVVNAFTVAEDYTYIDRDSYVSINEILVDLTSNNISLYKSEDESIRITYYESEYDKINVTAEDGKLSVIGEYKYKFRFFDFRIKPKEYKKVDIYLPNSFAGEVAIKLTSGELDILDFNLESLDIDLTSGDINLKNVNINTNLKVILTSGDAILDNVNVTNDATFNFTSGALSVNKMVANKIDVDLTSGSGKLTDITVNHIIGDMTSGDLDISIIGLKNDYTADLDVTSGRILYDGMKLSSQKLNLGKAKTITVSVTSGDINIEFKNN